jgi:hypothetical protein
VKRREDREKNSGNGRKNAEPIKNAEERKRKSKIQNRCCSIRADQERESLIVTKKQILANRRVYERPQISQRKQKKK